MKSMEIYDPACVVQPAYVVRLWTQMSYPSNEELVEWTGIPADQLTMLKKMM